MGSATTMVNRVLMCRRPFCCTECHRKFKTKEELYIHAEACVMEAFESEVIAAYSDVPGLRQNTLILPEVPPDSDPTQENSAAGIGITIKVLILKNWLKLVVNVVFIYRTEVHVIVWF
ncbi:hypothetical protein GCK32_004639 [Trichostrongylus colubriformis]|uniref:C2H2-type domain-containing protein n=1 Tax=Trichostrongylus colubriformis TaxID=6319 RepID=A0AAN8IHK8_TRICO